MYCFAGGGSFLKKRRNSLIIIFCLVLVLTGCWDRKEPESLAVVVGFGFDYDINTGEILIIAQIVNPLISQTGNDSGNSDKPAFWIVTGRGSSVFDALSDLRGKVSRELYYAHTQLELYSTTFLEEVGMFPVIDALERTGQTRPIIMMAVTEDDPQEILTASLPIEAINVMGLTRHIEITHRELGGTTSERARDFLNKLAAPGIEPMAVMLSLLNTTKQEEPGPSTKPPVEVIGKAVFRGDKFAGWLNMRETRGCNWVLDEIKTANIDIELPGEDTGVVSLNVKEAEGGFKPLIMGGRPEVKVRIKAQGRIVNISDVSSLKTEGELSRTLERKLAEVIRRDIELALNKARVLDSDVLGFGNSFYRCHYQEWLKMRDSWMEIYHQLPVTIEIEASIIKTGLINKGIMPR